MFCRELIALSGLSVLGAACEIYDFQSKQILDFFLVLFGRCFFCFLRVVVCPRLKSI